MAHRKWVSWWFFFTAPLMLWDAGYCLMRPRSMVGGDLHWLWMPYELYGQVDYVYGVKAFEDGEGFANAAAVMNVIENVFAMLYLYLVSRSSTAELAPLAGYTASSMTFAKTLLYVSQEYFCGFCAIGHNTLAGMMFYWVFPNIVWLTFSLSIMYHLGKDIVSSLKQGNNKVTANSKAN